MNEKSRPGEKAADPCENNSQHNAYPRHIALSAQAESYLAQLGDDLATGRVEYSQLPPSLREFYWFGWLDGNGCATSEKVRKLQHECDRLYVAAFNPQPLAPPSNQLTFEQLEQLRADIYRAEVSA